MRKFMVIFAAIFLLAVTAYAEDFSFRDGIYFGDTFDEVKNAENLGIMQSMQAVDDNSGMLRTYPTTTWGISDSDIVYEFDKTGALYRAYFCDGSYMSGIVSADKRKNYQTWESKLIETYGEQIGGNYDSPTAIAGYSFSSFNLYKARPGLNGVVTNCSERVIILENYNVKIEHILIESPIMGNSHYISFDLFRDEDAPEWATNKVGVNYGELTDEKSQNSADAAEFDFRKLKWGATEAEIREIEGEPLQIIDMPESNSICMAYQTTALGIDVALGYIVGESGLYSARYTIAEEHSSVLEVTDDFEKFKEALTEKYGTPILDWEEWDTEASKEIYANNKRLALEIGCLRYHVGYETNRTEILMLMGADNDEIDTVIVYTSKVVEASKPDYSDEI